MIQFLIYITLVNCQCRTSSWFRFHQVSSSPVTNFNRFASKRGSHFNDCYTECHIHVIITRVNVIYCKPLTFDKKGFGYKSNNPRKDKQSLGLSPILTNKYVTSHVIQYVTNSLFSPRFSNTMLTSAAKICTSRHKALIFQSDPFEKNLFFVFFFVTLSILHRCPDIISQL